MGRLASVKTAIGDTVYTYDKRGNILSAERYALKPRPLESVLYSYTGDILSSCTINQQTVSFSHDALGRMTSDGLAGTTIAYNHFDKPRIISKNHVNSGNYSYLADGTLVDVEDGLGLGLVYRGSLIYKKLPSSLGALAFESAGFEGGRVTPGGVKYHLTDHLGSVVMVLDGVSGTVPEANRYGEYGARTQLEGTSATAGRYHFSGKEDQDKTLGFPYTYCDGDPVNSVDEEGDSIAILKPKASIHIAMLIQKENGKWGYYSVNGDNVFVSGKFLGGKIKDDTGKSIFESVQSFLDSDFNTKDKNPDADPDESAGYYYSEAVILNKDTDDNKAVEEFMKESNRPYSINPFNPHQCANAVQNAIGGGGIAIRHRFYWPKLLYHYIEKHYGETKLKSNKESL